MENEKSFPVESSSHIVLFFLLGNTIVYQLSQNFNKLPKRKRQGLSFPPSITRGKIDKVCPLQVISRGKICLIQ